MSLVAQRIKGPATNTTIITHNKQQQSHTTIINYTQKNSHMIDLKHYGPPMEGLVQYLRHKITKDYKVRFLYSTILDRTMHNNTPSLHMIIRSKTLYLALHG